MSQSWDLPIAGCKVYSILTDIPLARDDDRILLLHIWIKELNLETATLNSFFRDFESGKISNPETITRTRRKLQEKHIELRGEKWEVRHKLEAAFCEQLTFFDKW